MKPLTVTPRLFLGLHRSILSILLLRASVAPPLLLSTTRLVSAQQLPFPSFNYNAFSTSSSASSAPTINKMMPDTGIYDFKPLDMKNEEYPMVNLKGKVILIVNVASKCGFTPQYKGLEELYEKYKDQGLMVLGFPCNQFGGQEPGSSEEIQNFCTVNYGIQFPIMSKVEVNGDNADPLWKYLKENKPGLLGMKRIKWNYEKFLIGRNGEIAERYVSTASPSSIAGAIERELKKEAKL